MGHITTRLNKFRESERGQGVSEYVLILALISLVTVGSLSGMGAIFDKMFDNMIDNVADNDKGHIIAKKSNFILHYGILSEKGMENAKRYDIAILEPFNVTKEQVKELEDSGTITYGYQSPLGVEAINKEKIEKMREDDYLYLDGVKRKSKHFGYYYGDIGSTHYREILDYFIQKDIVDKGFTGVFYDTIEDIDGFKGRVLRKELNDGYIDCFESLGQRFPDVSIIQNRALKLYIDGSAKHIDAMLYEDLSYKPHVDPVTGPFYNNLKDDLIKAQQESDSIIMAMSYKDAEENYEFAKKENWMYLYFETNPRLERIDKIHSVNTRLNYIQE